MKLGRQSLSKFFITLTLCLLAVGLGQQTARTVAASELAVPTFTISAPGKTFRTDTQTFGLTIEPTRHNTADSQYFYRTTEGLQSLKDLGVKTLLYTVDWNNWRALYDDTTGEPQTVNGSGIYPAEAVSIAKAVGAEIVPIVNVTVQCVHTGGDAAPYTTENMSCQKATVQDAVAFIKFIKTEAKNQGVPFNRVVMGLEPYAGCRYWALPQGINCTMDNPPGEHRIGLPAEEYAQLINNWVPKIHKADKPLLIGAQLSPNAFYCKTSCDHEWTQTVLQTAGKNIDFVLMHQYFRIRAPGAIDDASASTLSYYQNEVDINVIKRGATGMPTKMRKDVMKWAPSNKKQMPIWYGEMNAATPAYDDGELDDDSSARMRESLYSGLAVGELYLDMMAPVNISGNLTAGGTRVFLHHLFAPQTFIGAYMPPNSSVQVMVKTPAWRVLSILQDFNGQNWQNVQTKDVPNNVTGQPIIRAYATRVGKIVTIAFFNHDPAQTYSINTKLPDMNAKRVNITRVGDQALSFFSQNNELTPDAIVPVYSALTGAQNVKTGLSNLSLPAHSLTVLQITLK